MLKIISLLIVTIVATLPASGLEAAPDYMTTNASSDGLAGEDGETPTKWVCRGYCFLGGDLPTNPWRPIESEGATEQEARDNLDCDPYDQSGVSCRNVSN